MRVIDFHCDTILGLTHKKGCGNLKSNSLSVDIEKMKKSDYIAQFFAINIDIKKARSPLGEYLVAMNRFFIELQDNNKDIKLARNYNELINNSKEGKISAFLTIEDGGVLEGNINNLYNLFESGVRLITLTWNYPNELGYPNYNYRYKDKGITLFGKEVIQEMNRLGMIIDVSHLSDAGFNDVINISTKPIVASHSNARSIKENPRNLTDTMIKTISEKGGIVGINFYNIFLGDSKRSEIKDIVKHIRHIKNIGGIKVLSLGSDFDGIPCTVEISNSGEMNKLWDALLDSGFTIEEVEKVFYKNALRVIKEVLF